MKRSFPASVLFALPLLAVLAMPSGAQTYRTLRWAAIGDAVSNAGWPARAGVRLTADSIINYGYPGGTVLKSGDSSYWASGRLAQVFAYQPDIVSIHLGSADSKPVNWNADSANFTRDFRALVDTLASMPSKPRIIVVYPTPVWTDEGGAQDPGLRRNSVIANAIIPKLRAVAAEKGLDTADLYTPMLARQNLFANGITPAAAGNDTLGRLVFRAFVDQSIRIMCVGNSITDATGNNAKQRYPQRLNMMLGPRYWVWNGGKTGWWMQRAQLPGASGQFKSYVTDKNQMDTLFMMKPHFITIKLGTNDARQNFWNTQRFIADYQYFIDTLYNNLTPKPKFIPIKAIPAWRVNGNWPFSNGGANTPALNGINGDIIRDSLRPAIDSIAASRPAQVALVVDMYTPFQNGLGTLVPTSDGVHPNAVGLDTMARVLYRAIQPVVTTSIAPAAARPASRPASPALRVHLADGRVPEHLRGARVLSTDGRAVRPGADGKVPAGIYFVKPEEVRNAK